MVRDAFADQKALVPNAFVVIDAGACYGEVTRKYLDLWQDAAVHCFEPAPDTAKALEANLKGESRAIVNKTALWRESGSIEFNVFAHPGTNSTLGRPRSSKRYYSREAATPNETIQVPAQRLDEYCSTRHISAVDVLKMDTQGAELAILTGASSMLQEQRIHVVYTEMYFVPHYEHGPLYYHLMYHLKTYGYTLYGLYDLVHGQDGQLRFCDAIFVSEYLRSDVIDSLPEENL